MPTFILEAVTTFFYILTQNYTSCKADGLFGETTLTLKIKEYHQHSWLLETITVIKSYCAGLSGVPGVYYYARKKTPQVANVLWQQDVDLLKTSWQLIKEATRKVCRGFMMDGTTKLGDSDAAERCDASKEPKMFSNHSNFKHNQTVLLLLSSQSPPCLISRPSFEARQLWSLLDKNSVWNTIYTS